MLFTDFWLCWVFFAAQRLSLVAAHGRLIAVASLLQSTGSGSMAWFQQLRRTGLVAPWHVESS